MNAVNVLEAKKQELSKLFLQIKQLKEQTNTLQREIKDLAIEHRQANPFTNYIEILKQTNNTVAENQFVTFPNAGNCQVEDKSTLTVFTVSDLHSRQIILDKANKLFVLINLKNSTDTPEYKNSWRDVYMIEEVEKCEKITGWGRIWPAKQAGKKTSDGFQAKLKLKFSAKYDEIFGHGGRKPRGWIAKPEIKEYILRFDNKEACEHFITNFNLNVNTGGGKRIKMKTFVKVINGKKRVIHTGSKGGKYFIRNKKKVYLKKVKH